MSLHAITTSPVWHERRLERTIIRTYRTTADLYDVFPNEKQPRKGPKDDLELQRQIEANGGVFEPLLVEPHPAYEGKFRIVDGDRRWTNVKVLVEVQQKDQYRKLPVEVTDHTLTEEERLRIWIYIHRQRKEWDAKEKEMVAYSLVDMVGRVTSASILGVTVRELDRLVDIYELSEKLPTRELGASITWAREIKSLSRNLLTPPVLDALIKKINSKQVTNSKDVRKLRHILKDPVATADFLSDRGSIDSAMLKVGPPKLIRPEGLVGDLDELSESLKKYPWTALAALQGNADVLKKLEETEKLLKDLRQALNR